MGEGNAFASVSLKRSAAQKRCGNAMIKRIYSFCKYCACGGIQQKACAFRCREFTCYGKAWLLA